MEKLCSKCHKNPRRISGKRSQSYCIPCNKEYGLTHYKQHQGRNLGVWRNRNVDLDELIYSRKAKPCMDCGKSYPHYVMDFDHRDPKDKEYSISHMRRRRMEFSKILTEIDKCDVVCSNCHRERTNKQTPSRYQKFPGAH